jgi:hypothetical protein
MNNSNKNIKQTVKLISSELEINAYKGLVNELVNTTIPSNQLLAHLPLFLSRSSLQHILFMSDLYRRILDVQGDVIEFGVRWGRNLALFLSFRNIFEPHNYIRKVLGFDTFEGFKSVSDEDGNNPIVKEGNLAVSDSWEIKLAEILELHQNLSPRPHLKQFELIKGDVINTFPEYLEAHPDKIIALACFDMDIYKPTLEALKAVIPHLTKGSILGFDELCVSEFPGETIALKEIIDISKHKIIRSPYSGNQSFIVWGN